MRPSGQRWRRLKLAAGYGIAAAAVYFTVSRLEISAAEVWSSASGQRAWTVVAAMVLFMLHGAMNAFAFGHLLRALSAKSSVAASASAWCGSVLAKYIPGGVWQVVGRGVVLHRQGVESRPMLWASLLEQSISLLACVAVVLVASRTGGHGSYSAAWLAGPVIILFVLLVPWLVPASVGLSRAGPYVLAAGLYILALAPYAVGYLLLASPAVPAAFVQGLFEGTIAGVLAVLAPGGLGVRESWLVISQVDAGGREMLGALILARGLIIISEIVLTLLAIAYSRRPLPSTGGSR